MDLRPATERDLPAILELLLEDRATASEELPPDAPCYADALREMQASGSNTTYVAEEGGRIVGTFMLTFIRHLMRQGTLVAQLESVRVASDVRGHGIGEQMMRWAIAESRRRGCSRIQLTTHNSRTAAHRFYQRLGFHPTHLGMKLPLQ
jgi:GNAT superfamily N-acetyltransferase